MIRNDHFIMLSLSKPEPLPDPSSIRINALSNWTVSTLHNTFVSKLGRHHISFNHGSIGNKRWVLFQSFHQSGAWMDTGSHTAARSKTLRNTSCNMHYYHITVTYPAVSIHSSTILPRQSHPPTERYSHRAKLVSGRPYCFLILQLLQTITHFASCSQPGCSIPPFQFRQILRCLPQYHCYNPLFSIPFCVISRC